MRTETLLNACVCVCVCEEREEGCSLRQPISKNSSLPSRVPLNTDSRIGSSRHFEQAVEFFIGDPPRFPPRRSRGPSQSPRGGELISQSSGETFRFVFHRESRDVAWSKKESSSLC